MGPHYNPVTMSAGDTAGKRMPVEVGAQYGKILLEIIKEHMYYKVPDKQITIDKLWSIESVHLKSKYMNKQTLFNKQDVGRKTECYAFEKVDNEQIPSILKNGALIANARCSLLGNPKKGVVLQKFVDVLSEHLDRSKGTVVIYKVMLGNYLEVADDISNNHKDPSIGFDSHISDQLKSLDLKTEHSDIFRATQLYIYEHDEGRQITPYPRHILPFAIAEYSYMMDSMNPLTGRIPQPNRSKETSVQLNVYKGKLYSDKDFISNVTLRSLFLGLRWIEFPDNLTIKSNILTTKFRQEHLTGLPSLDPCRETYKPRTTGPGRNFVTVFQLSGGNAELKQLIKRLQHEDKTVALSIGDAMAFLLPQSNHTLKIGSLPVFNDVESQTSLHMILMSPSSMASNQKIMRKRAQHFGHLSCKYFARNKLQWRPMESKIEQMFNDFGKVNPATCILPSHEDFRKAFEQQRPPDTMAAAAISRESLETVSVGHGSHSRPTRTSFDLTEKSDEPPTKKVKHVTVEEPHISANESATADENSRCPLPQFHGIKINTSTTFFSGSDKPDAFLTNVNVLHNLLKNQESTKCEWDKNNGTDKMTSNREQDDDMAWSPISDYMEDQDTAPATEELSSGATPQLPRPEECVSPPPLPPPQKCVSPPPLPPHPPLQQCVSLPPLPPHEDDRNVEVDFPAGPCVNTPTNNHKLCLQNVQSVQPVMQHFPGPRPQHFPGPGPRHFPGPGPQHFPGPGQRHFPGPGSQHFPGPGPQHFPVPGPQHFPGQGPQHFPGPGPQHFPGPGPQHFPLQGPQHFPGPGPQIQFPNVLPTTYLDNQSVWADNSMARNYVNPHAQVAIPGFQFLGGRPPHSGGALTRSNEEGHLNVETCHKNNGAQMSFSLDWTNGLNALHVVAHRSKSPHGQIASNTDSVCASNGCLQLNSNNQCAESQSATDMKFISKIKMVGNQPGQLRRHNTIDDLTTAVVDIPSSAKASMTTSMQVNAADKKFGLPREANPVRTKDALPCGSGDGMQINSGEVLEDGISMKEEEFKNLSLGDQRKFLKKFIAKNKEALSHFTACLSAEVLCAIPSSRKEAIAHFKLCQRLVLPTLQLI